MAVTLQPVAPAWALQPSQHVRAIEPPRALIASMTCPLCGQPIGMHAPLAWGARGPEHQGCGREG